jgi:biopolymer transport protein ExbD
MQTLSRFHQPIAQPGPRLLHHIPLGFVQRKVAGAGAKAFNHEIPLIPFVDFLLCIVLFLLASFSASGELPIDKNVQLPFADNAIEMTTAPLVAITGTQILVDGTAAGSTRFIEEGGRVQKVDELFGILEAKRELWMQVNPNAPFAGVCVLQVDGEVPALVVKSVFQTAAYAGYPNISFMVQKRAAVSTH